MSEARETGFFCTIRGDTMNTILRNALAVAGMAVATQAAAQITFYEHENFEGRSFTTQKQVSTFERYGFNDRASSVVVDHDRWEICENAGYGGRCVVLRPGRYASLRSMGLNDRVSSVRAVDRDARIDDKRYAPMPAAAYDYGRRYDEHPSAYDYRRRNEEQLYQANVTSVRSVVGPNEQRCWIEHEQVPQDRGGPNVPAGIAGAVIGGVLGHQVGGGHGQDLATAGGAVAGGLIGANVGRDSGGTQTRDVQRCANTPAQSRAEYWDVTYDFRGQQHRVQMNSRPGHTVTVNAQGEPRMQP
jgi:uncharacterized protein YcfJ